MTIAAQVARLERRVAFMRSERTDLLDRYRTDPARLMVDAGFTPDPWQVSLMRSTAQQTLMVCARQVGKSTSTACLALHTALTQPGSTIVIVAPVEEQATELLTKVKTAYENIGRPIPAIGDRETRLKLANGSRVIALPGKESRVRSYTSTLLIIDEAARVIDSAYSASSPTRAVSRGRLVALSTAFAKSGWFYREWVGTDDFQRLSITAYDCPRIPREFLEAERRKLGDRWFGMEYLNQFGDDIASVFSTDDIRAALSDRVQPLFTSPATPPAFAADAATDRVQPLFFGGAA